MSSPEFPPEVIEALHNGRKIEAIKLWREHSGVGLKQAKEAIERHLGEQLQIARPRQKSDSGVGRLVAAALIIAGLYAAYRLLT